MKLYKIVTIIIILSFSQIIFCEDEKLTNEEIGKIYETSYKYEALGKYSESILSLNDLEKKYPNSYTVNYRIGWLYYLNKNYANSLKYLKKAKQIIPDSFDIMNIFCLIYNVREDWENLEAEAAKIIKIDYYNLNANYWFAVALKMQKKYDDAEKICNKVLAIYPTLTSFLALQAEINYYAGKYETSYVLFSNLKVIDSNNKVANYYLDLMNKAIKK